MGTVRRPPAKCKQTGKRILRSELDAKISLARLQWKDKGQRRYYRCPFCRQWHTTSQDRQQTTKETTQ